MNSTIAIETKSPHTSQAVMAWTTVLLASFLPDLLFRELTGSLPPWLEQAKVVLLAFLLLTSLLWKPLRELWQFFTVLLVGFLVQWSIGWTYQGLNTQAWLAGQPAFLQDLLSVQLPRVTSALLMVLVMLALTRSFEGFFFVKGKLDAPAAPIPWILTRPPTWRILGPAAAAAMCLGLLVFILAFGSLPSPRALRLALPFLPLIVLFAASNAFSEEMLYRATLLGTLNGCISPGQALLVTAFYFAIFHFYGVPYGVLGVLMAFIPGWLMGKAMLETRGFFWAWFIHFCMDAVIFFMIALGSTNPGG